MPFLCRHTPGAEPRPLETVASPGVSHGERCIGREQVEVLRFQHDIGYCFFCESPLSSSNLTQSECEHAQFRDFIILFNTNSQYLEEWVAHSRYSKNICWLTSKWEAHLNTPLSFFPAEKNIIILKRPIGYALFPLQGYTVFRIRHYLSLEWTCKFDWDRVA